MGRLDTCSLGRPVMRFRADEDHPETADSPVVFAIRVRRAPALDVEPATVLDQWGVLSRDGVHHVFGITAYGSWRKSTPIVSWDSASRTAVTVSGRRYVLLLANACGVESELRSNDVPDGLMDVTSAYLPAAEGPPPEVSPPR